MIVLGLAAALLGLEAPDIRLHGGAGLTTAGSFLRQEGIAWGAGGHAGLRVLTPGSMWAVGLEGTGFTTGFAREDGPGRLLHGGPVGEWRLGGVAHASVGTGPYHLDRTGSVEDPGRSWVVGGHMTLALEPTRWLPQWTPLLGYRSDVVLTRSVLSLRSLTLGCRWRF